MNSELKKEQSRLGFSSPLRDPLFNWFSTCGRLGILPIYPVTVGILPLSVSHLRVGWWLQGIGDSKAAGSFWFLLQLSTKTLLMIILSHVTLCLLYKCGSKKCLLLCLYLLCHNSNKVLPFLSQSSGLSPEELSCDEWMHDYFGSSYYTC